MLDGTKDPYRSRGFHLKRAIDAVIVQPECGGIDRDSTRKYAALT